MPIYNELTEYTVSLNLLLNMAIYFLIMCIYIYCFFIRKIVFNAITVYIGIGEILSIVFLSKYLPFALRNLMYSQIQLNIFVFGSFLVLYIMLLILHYKQNSCIKQQGLHKIVIGKFIHSLQHTGSIPARWTESIDSVFSVL